MITSVSDIKAIVDRIYNKSIVSWSRSWYSKRDINTNVYRRKSLTKQQKAESRNRKLLEQLLSFDKNIMEVF